ncbi:MAG: hypothetical protein KDC98_23460 [Planctomycetes bacterium]|nr:hypothetical protein [Planctomycetota bacterium]
MTKLKTAKMNKSKAKQRITEAKAKNKRTFWALILMVIAANIVNGEFALNDVDDLLDEGWKDQLKELKANIAEKTKELEKLEKAAQKAEARDRAKRDAKGNDPKAGRGPHRGR